MPTVNFDFNFAMSRHPGSAALKQFYNNQQALLKQQLDSMAIDVQNYNLNKANLEAECLKYLFIENAILRAKYIAFLRKSTSAFDTWADDDTRWDGEIIRILPTDYEKLKDLYTNLNKLNTEDNKQKPTDFLGLFFSGAEGGFFGALMNIFHSFQVMFNPGIALNVKEEKASPLCGELFAAGGEKARSLYRDKLKDLKDDKLTEEQLFNVFLKDVVKLESDSKKAHKLLEMAEKKIFNNRDGLLSLEDPANKLKITNMVRENLTQAGLRIGRTLAPAMMDSIINAIDQAMGALVNRYNDIKDSKLPPEEEQKVYAAIQSDRIKLLHYIVKTRALSKGETLSANKQFDLQYFLDQTVGKFVSMDTSLDQTGVIAGSDNMGIRKIFTPQHNKSFGDARVAAKRNIAIKITDVLAEINNLKDKMQGLIQVNLRELQRINALPAINEQRKGIVALEEKLNDMEQNGQFLLDKYNKLIRIFNGGNGECNKEILQQAIDLRNEAQQVLRDYTPRQQRQMPAIPG